MRNKTFFIVVLAAMLLVTACADTAIDRHALVMRNNPHVTKIDSLHSLTVGNGRFAFTALPMLRDCRLFPNIIKKACL